MSAEHEPARDRLTNYILGRLSSLEEEEVEDLFASDWEYFASYEQVERELISRYAAGTMGKMEAAQFERSYLVTPQRLQRVTIQQALHQLRGEEQQAIYQRPLALVAAGALIIAILTFSILFFGEYPRSDMKIESATLSNAMPHRLPIEAPAHAAKSSRSTKDETQLTFSDGLKANRSIETEHSRKTSADHRPFVPDPNIGPRLPAIPPATELPLPPSPTPIDSTPAALDTDLQAGLPRMPPEWRSPRADKTTASSGVKSMAPIRTPGPRIATPQRREEGTLAMEPAGHNLPPASPRQPTVAASNPSVSPLAELRSMLLATYPLSAAPPDRTDIVKSGAMLTLKQSGLTVTDLTSPTFYRNIYRYGFFGRDGVAWFARNFGCYMVTTENKG